MFSNLELLASYSATKRKPQSTLLTNQEKIAARADATTTKKRKSTTENDNVKKQKQINYSTPMCSDPTHYLRKSAPKQRHICRDCAQADFDCLQAIPHLTPWDKVCLMNVLSRAYFCGICLLEEEGPTCYDRKLKTRDVRMIPSATNCKRHSVYNSQHLCFTHKVQWTRCHMTACTTIAQAPGNASCAERTSRT